MERRAIRTNELKTFLEKLSVAFEKLGQAEFSLINSSKFFSDKRNEIFNKVKKDQEMRLRLDESQKEKVKIIVNIFSLIKI